ncbi:MAG: hypothetical protein IPP14_08335 [Planctomycetes bacterium]|nr:hypothetical protein [Planctomycetota bacterium]
MPRDHCLFAQYRFEIPLAGARVYAGGTTGGQTTGRQTGHNFTGQYYTLHRHYDLFTMRWTSPDPAASPWWNLYGYSGNNPAGAYDPDGLEGIEFSFSGYWGRVENIFTKGEFEFRLGTGGYSKRAEATWEGAAVKTFDTLTLGQLVTNNDRAAMAYKWQSQGLDGYYDAGGAVGSTTVLTALSIATAGAFSGAGMAGNVANIGLRSWMAGGAIAGAYGGAADAGIAGGGAGDMLASAAVGAAIGAGAEVVGAVGARLVSTGARTAARLEVRMVGLGSNFGNVRIGLRAPTSFRSFSAFKSAMGPAGEGMHWHHIVGQNPANVARFGTHRIHNTGNVVRIDAGVHARISGFYNSNLPGTNVLRRDWISSQSFAAQRRFGLQVLRRFGVTP